MRTTMRGNSNGRPVLLAVAVAAAAPLPLAAEDWPTYRHDNRRSGVTADRLSGQLVERWVCRSPVAPMTAWAGPAKWDAYSGNEGLQSMRNFDPAFFVTAAGGKVYFGSSVDHAVHCLDAATGEELWVAFAGGAVRLPPTISDGRAYFGADDGFAYCIDAGSGAELWKYRPAESPRLIPSDGKLISPWPVRTGVLVQGGLAYFGASLVPWETSYLCGLDATSGEPKFVGKPSGVTLQGALLGAPDRLYVPQGRSVPLVYSAVDGRSMGSVSGMGGTFCLLTEDERLVAMPSSQKSPGDVIQIAAPPGRGAMMRFAGADRLLVAGSMAYFHQGGSLKALDRAAFGKLEDEILKLSQRVKAARGEAGKIRKQIAAGGGGRGELERRAAELDAEANAASKAIPAAKAKQPGCYRWSAEFPAPFDLIQAGEVLLLGGDGEVLAVGAADGKRLWSAEVDGKVYGLAVAGGKLFASTGLGHIYCFAAP